MKNLEERFEQLVAIYRAAYAAMVLLGAALVVTGMTLAGAVWWMVPAGIFVGYLGVYVVKSLWADYLNELIMISEGSKVEA